MKITKEMVVSALHNLEGSIDSFDEDTLSCTHDVVSCLVQNPLGLKIHGPVISQIMKYPRSLGIFGPLPSSGEGTISEPKPYPGGAPPEPLSGINQVQTLCPYCSRKILIFVLKGQ